MEVGLEPVRLLARAGRALGLACLSALLLELPLRGASAETRAVPAVDLHVDLPYQLGYKSHAFAEGTGQFPARELLRAGVIGVVLPLFVPWRVSAGGPRLEDLEASYQRVTQAIPLTPPFQAPGCGGTTPVRTFLAFEGAGPLAEHPEQLASWVERGVRSVGLVHTRNNQLASSSSERAVSSGLTERGREIVRRANALGVPIDVSHASDLATREVLELARQAHVPVIATHSNARALTPVPRNLADAEIRAIAASGGVIGVNFYSHFLSSGQRASVADVVRHVRYLVNVAGPDHVALGSDFEGDITPPRGLESVRQLPELAARLSASGLSRATVERVFSRNALRVLCPPGALARPP